MDFEDVCANSRLLARGICGPFAGQVAKVTRSRCTELIEYNNLSRVEVHPFTLSNSAGIRGYYSKENHSGASSLQDHALGLHSDSSIRSVATFYLESNVPVPKGLKVFAKIDAESHEYFAMESLFAWSHAADIDQIFVEFDARMSDVEELAELLASNNFYEIRRTGSSTHWDAPWSRWRLFSIKLVMRCNLYEGYILDFWLHVIPLGV